MSPLARAVANLALASGLALGCRAPLETLPDTPLITHPAPVASPEIKTIFEPQNITAPSAASFALERYYQRRQSALLARGMLRQDGGGDDTPFTDTMLVNNFRAIALGEEYERNGGLQASRSADGRIKKWTKPVRVAVDFAPLVSPLQIQDDRAMVARFTRRLARVTGHPIALSKRDPNFHVIFATHDDLDYAAQRLLQIVPDINHDVLNLVRTLPRDLHCIAMAFATTQGGYDYDQVVTLIRAEHPDLTRRSCVHEEMAQGLGAVNDSPQARPSIFNDNDEFALLTRHDEVLLKMLYDPRLKPGMTEAQSLPILRDIAARSVISQR